MKRIQLPPGPWQWAGGLLAVVLWLQTTGAVAGPQKYPPLTTVPDSPRLPGKFVWADLVTDDAAAARTFYGRLFGWTFQDLNGYLIAANDERPLAGILQRPRPTNPNAKPRWLAYMSVPDVERAQRTVTGAGGKVLAPPVEIPGRGLQAVFGDPEGAPFGVVKSSAGDPPDFLADPGDWIWIELLSRDARKAGEFYKTLVDYEVLDNTASNRLNDCVLASKGYARAVIGTIPKNNERVQPTWLLFVRVKNIGESVAKTRELGGKTLIEPRSDLFNGKVAVIADPTGAAVGLLEWSPDMKGGQ